MSELSHKLGSAQGSSQSLEQEVGQLRAQLKQLAGEKHSLEMQLSDTKAKLLALQEKVRQLVSAHCDPDLHVFQWTWHLLGNIRPQPGACDCQSKQALVSCCAQNQH